MTSGRVIVNESLMASLGGRATRYSSRRGSCRAGNGGQVNMGSVDVGYRFIVTGRVQGVFFRASAAREASRLGLRGHAINLPDGNVEVLAVGPAVAVEQLRRWLQHGPPGARVDGVFATAASPAGVSGFRTG